MRKLPLNMPWNFAVLMQLFHKAKESALAVSSTDERLPSIQRTSSRWYVCIYERAVRIRRFPFFFYDERLFILIPPWRMTLYGVSIFFFNRQLGEHMHIPNYHLIFSFEGCTFFRQALGGFLTMRLRKLYLILIPLRKGRMTESS
jgi:hypothetical protein